MNFVLAFLQIIIFLPPPPSPHPPSQQKKEWVREVKKNAFEHPRVKRRERTWEIGTGEGGRLGASFRGLWVGLVGRLWLTSAWSGVGFGVLSAHGS